MTLSEAMIGQCVHCGGNLTASHDCPRSQEARALANKLKKPEPKRKASHIGAPAVFALEQACQHLTKAFGGFGCYVVGSATERADWRDVDVRFILEDAEFAALFPDSEQYAEGGGTWEFDPRWLLMTVSISGWLSKVTGLPIDFQFQPQTHANKRHKGPRHPFGLRFAKRADNGDGE